VEQGQGAERDAGRGRSQQPARRLRVATEVSVSQLRALETTRRTGGVENRGGVVIRAFDDVSPRLRPADQALEVDGLHENAFRAGLRASVRGIGVLVRSEEQLRLGSPR
jgi:hypothetical protein